MAFGVTELDTDLQARLLLSHRRIASLRVLAHRCLRVIESRRVALGPGGQTGNIAPPSSGRDTQGGTEPSGDVSGRAGQSGREGTVTPPISDSEGWSLVGDEGL